MKTLAPIVLSVLFGSAALAQEPTPEPAATATPETTATPPAPTPTPEPEATPEPTMARGLITVERTRDFRGGLPHRPPGVRPLRGLAAIGGHVFYGDGWNRDAELPGEDPPKSLDYPGGGLRLGLLYELTKNIAGGAQIGGHQGAHELDERPGLASPVVVSYALYYGAVSARWQSTPGPAGMYLELGGGAGAGRRIVTHPNDAEDEDEDDVTPTVVGFGAIGGTGNVAQGIDVFFELRYMVAPDAADSFTSDDDLDLGGLTATTGILVRL